MTEFHDPTNEPCNPLSTAGMQRRDEMLADLIIGMRQMHRRRRLQRKLILLGIAPVAVLMTFGILWRGSKQDRPDASQMTAQNSIAVVEPLPQESSMGLSTLAEASSSLIVVHVQTDPTIVDRWRAVPIATVDIIDDLTLLQTLAAVGRPVGLIRSQSRLWLTRPVTDQSIASPAVNPDNASMNWFQSLQERDKTRS